jgi:hypothetical protein
MVEERKMTKVKPARLNRLGARAGIVAALLIASAMAFGVPAASASIEIESFSTTGTDPQAGGHPDLSTTFFLKNPGAPEAAKNVSFEAPRGIFGNPEAIARCTTLDFALDQCFPSAQAGLITVYAKYENESKFLLGTVPIFNMEVPKSKVAQFAFTVPTLNFPIIIPVTVRTSEDFGLRFTVSNISQKTPLAGAHLTFWGFPLEATHDAERFPKGTPGNPPECAGLASTACIENPTPSPIEVHPLIDNPTTCTGQPLVTKLKVQSYQDDQHVSETESTYPAIEGCENEVFKPVLQARPTTVETDSATGVDIELRDPLFLGKAASPSQIRGAVVKFPEGLTINPDAADGQRACTDDQANFDTEGPDECPDNSKIGNITIHSVALSDSLEGAIYFGEPKPGDQYRIFMMANGYGIHAKLVGSVRPDPVTGKVSVYFEDLPQVPFDEFDVHLFASDRGMMATPTQCTIYETEALFIPWNAAHPPVTSKQTFGIDSGPNGGPCPGQVRPFHPRLEAGTTSSHAGDFSSFILKLDRDDGDQYLGGRNFKMPPGFTGSLRGISYCSEAAIAHAASNLGRTELASPSCPAASVIGSSNVAAGPGAHPFHAVGKIYLAGPFKGAPLSLAAVTPALAGPYDYGVVVVRVALHVDPLTAQVSAVSDTVPSIIGGVPIRMRSIQVNTDRPNFTINPTNCDPLSVDSEGIGDQGTVANFSSFFHVDNCSGLGFAPAMAMRVRGNRRSTSRSSNPALELDLRTRPGDANIKSLAVTLPSAFAIDQRHLGNICSEKELAASNCAGRTPIGKAMTTTPLLDQPLAGPVYAVSGSGGLPKLAFILNGQVDLLPRAETKTLSSANGAGRLATTVPVIPDAPIGHFHLSVFGGKTGYLVNTRSLCGKTPVADIAYVAQSGKTLSQKVKIKAPCGKKKARHKRHRG